MIRFFINAAVRALPAPDSLQRGARSKWRRRRSGFTLVELAVVLLILGLLLGGLLVPLSAQLDQQSIKETQRRLDEIREAIIGFALANGRLPCPAEPATVTGATGAGEERSSCTSSSSEMGALPWVTLGISETDAWGRRFTYRVAGEWADLPNPPATATSDCSDVATQASFALCSEGTIRVCNGTPCNTSSPPAPIVADKLPAVIVSHGKNGRGAFLPTGTQIPGASGDELENVDNDKNFVSRTPDDNFDDLIVWISPAILKNRMVQAGKLP